MSEQLRLADYEGPNDFTKYSLLDGKQHTITGIKPFTDTYQGESSEAVQITTKETFDGHQKFVTQRTVIVKKLKNAELMERVNGGSPLGPVVVKKVPDKKYFDIFDA